MTRSLVLLSGGLDSCVAAAQAQHQGREVIGLSFAYGSRHEHQEGQAAMRVARALDIDLAFVRIPPDIFEGSGSALIPDDGTPMPAQSYEQLSESDGPSPTYVPYRNGTLLSIATARALSLGCDEVIAGAHAEDAAGFAYPDCTPEFNGAMAAAVYVGTYHKVRLRFPFQEYTKTDIVLVGTDLDAPLEQTWSCYAPQVAEGFSGRDGTVVPCGKCPTCVGRAHAFAEAGITDPALAVQ